MIITFFDIETTGLNPQWHEIIEVGLIRIDFSKGFMAPKDVNIRDVDIYHSKVKPRYIERADDKALELNGYSPEEWEQAPFLEQILPKMKRMFTDAYLAGHNVSFDRSFLWPAWVRSFGGEPRLAGYRPIDTASMSVGLWLRSQIENRSLKNLCDYFGVSNEGAHGALEDAWRCAQVFLHMVNRRGCRHCKHCTSEIPF